MSPSSKRKISITDCLSVIGAISSIIGIAISLAVVWNVTYEWLIGIGSVFVSFLAGVFSKNVSNSVRKMTHSRRVFLSYAHEFQSEVEKVAEVIRKGGTKVWIDKDRIHAGESFREAISKGIDDADSIVVFLGKEISPNLMFELGMAQAKGKRIIPVLLEDTQIPSDLEGLRYVDLRRDKESGIQELVKAIT